MPIHLITGPAGSGKTRRALSLYSAFSPLEQCRGVRLVLPSLREVISMRAHLHTMPSFPGFLGDTVCTLTALVKELSGVPEIVTAKERGELLVELAEGIPVYEPIRHTPGFGPAASAAVSRLMHAQIEPTEGTDTATLYARYLARQVPDVEGLLCRGISCSLTRVIFDGFEDYSPLQVDFMRTLSRAGAEVYATLPYECRPELCAGVRAYDLLAREADVEALPPSGTGTIGNLERGIFSRKPKRTIPDGSIEILTAESPGGEVRAVAREIRRLGLTDVAVVARETWRYRRAFTAAFAEYGIPVNLPSAPLSESPFARAVAGCLRAAAGDEGAAECARRAGYLGDELSEVIVELAENLQKDPERALARLVSHFRFPTDEAALADDGAAWAAIERTGNTDGTYGGGGHGVPLLSSTGGRKFGTIFFIGLTDSAFPQKKAEDPFLRGLLPADPYADRRLFYSTITAAREKLYLTLPAADIRGRRVFPSPYIREVEALFLQPLPHTYCPDEPGFADAASLPDLLSALFHSPDAVEHAAVYDTLLRMELLPDAILG